MKNKISPEMIEIMKVAKYLGIQRNEILSMPFKEFTDWLAFIKMYPSQEQLLDIHLSRMYSSLTGSNIEENLIWISPEEKTEIKEQINKQKLMKSLEDFGNFNKGK